MSDISPSLLKNLAMLRWFAVAGQTVAVALVAYGFGMPLRTAPLWFGIAALALFNTWARWRARVVVRPSPFEVFAHVFVDIAVLAWLIGWSGGAMNPFTPLFLLPIALVAVTLPVRWVVATAIVCCAGYAIPAWFGQPLPPVHGLFGDAFDLHLTGMAVMFAISVAVITFFLTRLAQALRAREQELAHLREQFARNEGIVALATHAAAVAHELNTPLGTLTLMLEDQLDQWPRAPVDRTDLETMTALVDACRDRVRELAAPAENVLTDDISVAIDRVVERWQLVRPAIALERAGVVDAGQGHRLDAGIGHLLQALLNNAADAGELAGSARVELRVETIGDELVGSVRDHGSGFDRAEAALSGPLFRSSKRDGLGVGLALSHATLERLGGALSIRPAYGGGAIVGFRLPLNARSGGP